MPSSLKWIVKLDDDVIVNVTKLDDYLSNVNIDREAIHCQIKPPTGMVIQKKPPISMVIQGRTESFVKINEKCFMNTSDWHFCQV